MQVGGLQTELEELMVSRRQLEERWREAAAEVARWACWQCFRCFTLFENKVLNPSPRLNEGARAAREVAIAEDLGRRTAEAQAREALLRANEAEAMLARSDECFGLARFWQLLCVSKIK